jgi:signal recognition particle GTPase
MKKKKEELLWEELAKKLDEIDVTLKTANKIIDDAEERKRVGQFP